MIEAVFIDGPAAGKVLNPQRGPLVFMRVVVDAGGVWDCLDALEDEAADDEAIHVYRMKGRPSFACTRGRSGHRRSYHMITYQHVDADAEALGLRDNSTWREWAEAQR
jgi:hypothetical protein